MRVVEREVVQNLRSGQLIEAANVVLNVVFGKKPARRKSRVSDKLLRETLKAVRRGPKKGQYRRKVRALVETLQMREKARRPNPHASRWDGNRTSIRFLAMAGELRNDSSNREDDIDVPDDELTRLENLYHDWIVGGFNRRGEPTPARRVPDAGDAIIPFPANRSPDHLALTL